MSFRIAISAFQDNLRHMNSRQDPVNYNLNLGLFNIAKELDEMHLALKFLDQKVEKLLRK